MADTSQTTMDVTELLKDDHDKVRSLLKDLESADGSERKKILKTIQKEFHLHSDVEEEIVYPAYKECLEERQARVEVSESLDEHRIAKETLQEMMDLDEGSIQFDGKMKLLNEQIEHHAKDEEENMFPKMREACSEEQLRSLARRVQEAKQKGSGSG